MTAITLNNPFTGEPVFSANSESFSAVNEKISAARSASSEWSGLPAVQRAEAVSQALHYFEKHKDEIAAGITRQMGKPLQAAGEELDFMLGRARQMCEFAKQGALDSVDLSRWWDEGFQGRIDFRAKGIFYIISPWNYPLFCAINGTMCALLAGSAVLLKHTTTPSVGAHFERAFAELSGIKGLVQHVVVDFETSARIIEEADINHVAFTGSVRGGRDIATSVARRCQNDVQSPFIQCSLELGSNDAAYIAEDADLDDAVFWTVKIGRLHNSGQSCCATKRVYVHSSVYDDYLAAAKAIMESERNGDPTDPDTTLGPLFAGRPGIDYLLDLVNDAQSKGAKIVLGGTIERIGTCDFLEPTLISNVDHDMHVMHEETFGPVLPVMCVDDDEAATRLVKDTRYGLTSSIFTTSRRRADAFVSAMEHGTVYVNCCNYVDARLGWIGHGHSGNGSIALSPAGLQAFSAMRSVNVNPKNPLL
jgi:acyl-CoA reductase-like NAD-dependent aldehyde dehydrogenase